MRFEYVPDAPTGSQDDDPISELRMAINENQPIGHLRFYARIEATPGQRREVEKRGRPRRTSGLDLSCEGEEVELPF